MKKKWWIFGGVLAALLLSLCFFAVRLRIAPRLILSGALGTALEQMEEQQLEERFEDSPVQLIAEAMEQEGRQRAEFQLETEQGLLGVVRYDMQLQTQLNPCRVLAKGTVITGGKALDLSLYLDGDYAAVSSESLVEGSYYGITYDTFSRDIRDRQFLAALIGEKTISDWEASVSALDQAMSRDIKLPEWETEDIVSALYGIMALKPRVSRIDTPAGAAAKTDAVIFRATGREIAELAEPYRQQLTPELLAMIEQWRTDEAAFVQVTFFLHKGALVEVHLVMETSLEQTTVFATLGTNPGSGQLALEIMTESGENTGRTRLEIETVSDGETYGEKVRLTQNKNRVQTRTSLEYAYDLSTGEMDLTILRDGDKAQLRLNLAGERDRVTITSQNVTPLLNLFLKKPLESPAICTLRVSPGDDVAVPEYRNLDQWSMEDLFALIKGFGVLLGVQLP